MKEYLDSLVQKYENKDFIKDDPIQFPHRYKNSTTENLEIIAFVSSIFAYGRRENFISKLKQIFEILGDNPYSFVLNFEKNEHRFNNIIYRFYKDTDIKILFYFLFKLFKNGMTIGDFFFENKSKDPKRMLENVFDKINYFLDNKTSNGFSFMIPNPKKGGANKRMFMFLRWMVRKGPVDFGIWDFLKPDDLIIPLDVHVGNVSRDLNLLDRNLNDFKSAWLLTEKLKEFDPKDPVKYDFALFGAGVNKDNSQVLIKH